MPDRRTHPEDGDLLRYCDGELRARDTERVARHLEACWDCRTIGEYVRYRRDVLEPALPQPPLPWKNLRTEFVRMPARRQFPRRAVWLIACAATAGTGVWLYKSSQPAPKPRPAQPAAVVVKPVPAAPVIAATPSPVVRREAPRPGPEDELRVVAALDRIGAGLGDPIEVVRTPERIVVTCIGLSDTRMREVRAAVAGMPGVSVELSPKPAATAPGSPLDVVGAPHTTEDQQLADELLKHSEALMARAHALRRLAARFPEGVESAMSRPSKETLAQLRERHEAALAHEAAAIAGPLEPLPPAVGGRRSEDWQAHAMRLFTDAAQVDRLLGAVYAGNRGDAAADRAALAAAVAKLEADVR